MALATIDNVGFDATGRRREGSKLPNFANYMNKAISEGVPLEFVDLRYYEKKLETFSGLSDVFITKQKGKNDTYLADVCQFIGTGRTPARRDYSPKGNFLIKVGNLSGSGINWEARDRNFISQHETEKRRNSKKPLILQRGDILLTASAHSPIYIARKSDIFTKIPSFINTKYLSFVGEVMLIRVNPNKIDPYLLLAFLRARETIETIQKMVRGQTAHLHPTDISQLVLPKELFKSGSRYGKVAEIIREQNELSDKISVLLAKQAHILNSTNTQR